MHYQILARKYRPKTFKEVIGQESVVQTLKNALKFKRVAQAYLFSGTRGTGKTTLARLFAKALNCINLNEDTEPCNQCPSCLSIQNNNSLDVLEIDGASNRGIDDIRQINETLSYASFTGGCKIYIIDEVHMLTKEAFNALLKTLEEPPANVKFFFATTEAHKVLPTIVSRCQRFDLQRISEKSIVSKLQSIIVELGVTVEKEAISLISEIAEGSLRDAESLLDQILCLNQSPITLTIVENALGIAPREDFFAFDEAAIHGKVSFAFTFSAKLYSEGKDPAHFLEGLLKHYRHILLTALNEHSIQSESMSEKESSYYERIAKIYTPEQCFDILEVLSNSFEFMAKTSFQRIHLEMILMQAIRAMKKIPVELISSTAPTPVKEQSKEVVAPIHVEIPPQAPTPIVQKIVEEPKAEEKPAVITNIEEQQRLETMLRFASVELNGTLQ